MTDIVRVDALRHAIEAEFPEVTVSDDQALAILEKFDAFVGPATVVATTDTSLLNAARYVEAVNQGLVTAMDEQDIDAELNRRRSGG